MSTELPPALAGRFELAPHTSAPILRIKLYAGGWAGITAECAGLDGDFSAEELEAIAAWMRGQEPAP